MQLRRLTSLLMLFLGWMTVIRPGSIIAQEGKPETRAMWVTRGEYSRTAEDIRRIVRDCAELNLNVILFQVRGNGTAFYKSPFEPWAEELGGGDPGFDPLEVAITEAHAAGIELHAWINAMPGWRGTALPTSPNQLYNAKREWFVVDSLGQPEPLTEHYVNLSAGIPEVQDYIASICIDIAKRYNIDGLHLDYIRFSGSRYSYDSTTVSRFVAKFGTSPLELRDEWSQFRRDQITEIVRKVRAGTRSVKPKLRLSVAALRIYARAYGIYFQDARGWLKEGMIDDAFNMLYVPDMENFSSILMDGVKSVPGRNLFPGIGVRNLSPDQLVAQILKTRELGARGFCFFSYGTLFPVPHRQDTLATDSGRREQLRKALLEGPLRVRVRSAK